MTRKKKKGSYKKVKTVLEENFCFFFLVFSCWYPAISWFDCVVCPGGEGEGLYRCGNHMDGGAGTRFISEVSSP